MGQAKQSRKTHAAVLEKFARCIYCGGSEAATTVDHMPPSICFRWKLRPKGLEFPSCKICNEGASHAGLVAGLISRFYESKNESNYVGELTKLFRSLETNIPGLLKEMKKPRGAEKLAMRRLPPEFEGGLLNISGPLVSHYMSIFALKMGLALHYEVSGNCLEPKGRIAARWFTNYEKFTGDFPEELSLIFPEPKTLQNGKKHVSDQFQYTWRLSDDRSFGAYFASFRMSFAVVAFVANDAAILHVPNGSIKIYSPLDVKNLIKS